MIEHRNGNRRSSRHAVSLIELLIVLALVLVLAAVSLPTVKNTMRDHRVSEAARIVQAFLETARSKAIASNRPVAAILARNGASNAELVNLATCVNLSIGETFPPYEGDWSSATGTLKDAYDAAGNLGTDGIVESLDIPYAQVATITSLVSIGDTIEIGDAGHFFEIQSVGTAPPPSTDIRVRFFNPPKIGLLPLQEARLSAIAGHSGIRFRIYRKPSKTLASAIALPRGICIDLAHSGFGPNGFQLADCDNNTMTSSSTAAWDSRRSIYIVFNPRGAIATVYEYQEELAGTATAKPAFNMPNGQLHLLIGRTEQVDTTQSQVSDRDDFIPNHLDTGNRWVSVNTFNGLVHTSDVGAPDAGGSLAASRIFATTHAPAKN